MSTSAARRVEGNEAFSAENAQAKGAPLRAVPTQDPAPFLKWAGGKGRLLSQLTPLLPPGAELRRHVEPFFGGGALFFARQPSRALISDVNPNLIATYRAVRDDVDGVVERLAPLAARHSQTHYYRVRERYNASVNIDEVDRAAMFIYLNKTCFNGLHRVNGKGQFNVPAGNYKNPKILDLDALRAASAALQGADIRCEGFESMLRDARPGDFVYFDPPYAPMSETANFTSYALGGFGAADQIRLRDVYRELDRRGCRLMLSNSDVPFIREIFKDYRIDTVMAARAINSDASRRGPVPEVVVRNY
ncbi:MAG: DNA adenine methylase [Myxococcales bacterium]|nr:DNA adenine methylase [Myxococcales bacterium]